ncbi:MAG: hypothetical protein KF887_18955 [Paracoccaceae bacterium]|nr:MAG: hypothetical protein KF887_18955 [Paracoccaceae bacterium]
MTLRHLIPAAFATLLLSAPAVVALSAQDLIDSYSAEGFTRIEVKSGPTQTKVEAIRGTEKVEVVYDNASGSVLKREVETVAAGARAGIEIDTRDRDFLRSARSDDGASDDDGSDGHGRGRGRGGDDSRDGDDRGDDNGGRGRGRGRGGDDD